MSLRLFQDLAIQLRFNGFSLNDQGQFLLFAQLTGKGITNDNDVGIWAQDINGQLQLIAREGDLLDVNDDPTIEDFRTISSISIIPFNGFNDLGQVVFRAVFTDGTDGVFVSNKVRFILGDVNRDGAINLLDVSPFIAILGNGDFQAEADINRDGNVNLLDVMGFIQLLGS